MFGVTRRADDNTRMEPTDSKLQGIISCFDQFYNHFINVSKERDEFVEKIRWYTSENERLQKTTEKLQRDLSSLHEMVGKSHQQVVQIDTLTERNRDLKDKCVTLEQDLKTKEQQYEERLQQQRKENEEALALVIESREKNAATERQRMLDLVEEKNKEISELKEAIAMAKKEKEDEITVLSMEYENKLAKVQKQKSQILENTQQTTNQDIFRKKLQHMKKSHEAEVLALKQQIRQLEGQVAKAQQSVPAPQSSHFASAFGSRSKRK